MTRVKEIPFEVLGKKWTLRLMKRRKYDKKNGKDSLAMTYRLKRRIDLSPKGRDLETITHEIVHAYLTELCLDSVTLSPDELEEIFCELVAKHGMVLLGTAESLFNTIQALEEVT